MTHRTRALSTIAALCLVPPLAQAQRYQPTLSNPTGLELVGVYISSTWCVGNRAPGLREAIDTLKLILQQRAQQAGRKFRMIGVAIDWAPDSGLAYLREFGAFDELIVGRNWFSIAAERFIWGDSTAPAAIPQILIYEQSITPGGSRIAFSPPRVVSRVFGGDSIVAWVRRGARSP